MGLLNRLRKKDRKFWHVCYACMGRSGHDPLLSVFYSTGPPVEFLGRPLTKCPRCGDTNTVSFQKLKDDGSEAQLWGMEQVVKKHPRSVFEVKPAAAASETLRGPA